MSLMKTQKNPRLLSEEFVKRSVIMWLSNNGWGTGLVFGDLHGHGVDIKVRHNNYSRYFHIEAKKEGKIGPNNEVAFIYSLGQIITRMKNGGTTRTYYGLALPEVSAKIAVRRIPWQVAKKLLLYVFAVARDGKVKQYSWQDLKKHQKK